MKNLIILSSIFLLGSGVMFAQYDDDIYYNAGKEKQKQQNLASGLDANGRVVADGYYYNPNLGEYSNPSEQDIDAYNGYGGYYETAIDTIGAAVANSEDFVYTQQIQKYYNPTIVTDNQAVLADIIANSYGNVNVVYNGFTPVFSSWSFGWPWFNFSYYGSYWSSWRWGWGPSWTWFDPWYWGGFSWGWYDPWYWGGHSWAWNYPSHHHWTNHHRNSGAGRPGTGYRYNTGLGRGGNIGRGRGGYASGTRPDTGIRPSTGKRPSGTEVYNYNSHRGQSVLGNTTRPTVTRTDNNAANRFGTTRNIGTVRTGNLNNGSATSVDRNNNRVGSAISGGRGTTVRPNTNSIRPNTGTTIRNTGTSRNSGSSYRGGSSIGRTSGSSYRPSTSHSRGSFGGGSRGGSHSGGSRGGGHRR